LVLAVASKSQNVFVNDWKRGMIMDLGPGIASEWLLLHLVKGRLFLLDGYVENRLTIRFKSNCGENMFDTNRVSTFLTRLGELIGDHLTIRL
jgi:hypothetical protein